MPASRAISSVDPPCSPCSANTATAASRISSRRSSFDFRYCVTTMRGRLVMTHKFVKGFRDTVEVGLRQRGVEGQRERALEDARGSGEVALVAVGAEQVEAVGADLRLDSLGAER